MDYEKIFAEAIAGLQDEGRHRVFADLEGKAGASPGAVRHGAKGAREVTVWCSDEYLGLGENASVLIAMLAALEECGVSVVGP